MAFLPLVIISIMTIMRREEAVVLLILVSIPAPLTVQGMVTKSFLIHELYIASFFFKSQCKLNPSNLDRVTMREKGVGGMF